MLVAFDFDGALASSDPFVRLGEQHGTSGNITAIQDRMSTGDLDFETGLRSIAESLEGLPVADAEAAYDHVRIRPAASDLLASLHRAGHHVAVISDAPERAIQSCQDPYDFGIDTIVANRLPTANGALTGDIEGPLVGRGKDEALKQIAVEQGRALDETVAVGDDRRDLSMLQAAGQGIGVDPEQTVEAQCDRYVPSVDRLELRFEEQNMV